MFTASPLVSAEWLEKHIDAPDVRVIDATWFAPFLNPEKTGQEAYDEGHIPGAVFFDIDQIAAPESPFPHTMPDPILFSSRVRKLGLGDGHRIIVYDQNGFFASARVWWMLRAMGVTDVSVLDGGLQAWLDHGGAIEDLPPVAIERHFTPRVRADLIKTTDQITETVRDKKAQIIDARPPGRFSGEAPEPRKGLASGHIPGSVNIPGGAYITASRHMKTADELETLFAESGVDTSAPIIASCGSGVTAAITALALAVTGNELVAVYDGSWTEWASDPDNPIATGTPA